MQYFVVLEDTKNLRWQAELLYESVRLLDLADHFLIAICPGKNGISEHIYSNVVYFNNIGRKTGFPHLNKCYGLIKALELGKLKQPFVLLDTDMFLLDQIPRTKAIVSAQPHQWLSWDNIDERVKDLVEDKSYWKPFGGVYLFNQVPIKVYEDIFKYTHDLYVEFGNDPKWSAYGINLALANNRISFEGGKYETSLMHDGSFDDGRIVHYRNGYPPYFDKNKVFDTINFSFDLPLPFKMILESPSKNRPNVSVMQTLIHSWLDFNLIRLHCLL